MDASGVLRERYEYTPYGERTVYWSQGTNDVGCYAITNASRRDGTFPQGLCDIGHQGLMHDEEVGLVYNRARELAPTIGRFLQRDPIGFYGGTSNFYETEMSDPENLLDRTGLSPAPTWNQAVPRSCAGLTIDQSIAAMDEAYNRSADLWNREGSTPRQQFYYNRFKALEECSRALGDDEKMSNFAYCKRPLRERHLQDSNTNT